MNLRDLEYLVALSELQHFGKAAQKCFVSQPTLSSQIKKLEIELDTSLIERGSKTFILTQTGKEVVEKAKQILSLSKEIIEVSKFSKNPFKGTLKIGLIPTVGPYLLPLVLKKIKNEFPELKLILSEKKTHEIIEALNSGDLDCGILGVPLQYPKFEEQNLYIEPFVLLCPPSEKKEASPQKIDSKEALSKKSILLLEEGHCFGDQALELCSRSNSNIPNDMRATSLEMLKHMVSLGQHHTLVPRLALHQWSLANNELNTLEFSEPIPSRTVGIIYRKNSSRTELFTALKEIIQTMLPKELIQNEKEADILKIN